MAHHTELFSLTIFPTPFWNKERINKKKCNVYNFVQMMAKSGKVCCCYWCLVKCCWLSFLYKYYNLHIFFLEI